eukprot:TRINITY_DN5775_c0_g1_i1.p2 TRINITY_DN5775_c0_g1~~TRINITY_DN5775_c0_g1_i1.p2  ORF type:complete len:487 (+),score=140.65 TRINITY_DN5775_c0_g1_i1:2205-3665(+)
MADEMAAFMRDVYNCTEVHVGYDDGSHRAPGSPLKADGNGVWPADEVRDIAADVDQQVLNGGAVNLLLYLRPKPDLLETVAHRFPGVAGDRWKQLACWNIVTSNLELHMDLVPGSDPGLRAATRFSPGRVPIFPGRTVVSHVDTQASPSAGGKPSPSTVTYPSRPVTLVQQAMWGEEGTAACQPSIYTVSFVVNVGEMPPGESYTLQMVLDVGNLARIMAKMAGLTDVAVGTVARRPLEYTAAEDVGDLCPRSDDETAAVLRQLRAVETEVGGRGQPGQSCLLTVLWPLNLVDPLSVTATHAEPLPGHNIIQVAVANALDVPVTLHDLSIHLPTSLPARELPHGLSNDCAPLTTLCSLSTVPSIVDAAVFGSGFDGHLKFECYLTGAGDAESTLPAVIGGGETYCFVFVIRAYDAAPGRAVQEDARAVQQQSALTVAYYVEGARSMFDKEARVVWTMLAGGKAPATASTAEVVPTDPPFLMPKVAP